MYKCSPCKYFSTRKLNYERHLMSKKHNKICEKIQNKNTKKINNDTITQHIVNTIGIKSCNDDTKCLLFRILLSQSIVASICVNIIINNIDMTMIKVENYIVSIRYCSLTRDCSIKTSQVNCLQTDAIPNISTISNYESN